VRLGTAALVMEQVRMEGFKEPYPWPEHLTICSPSFAPHMVVMQVSYLICICFKT
jgi:hypothetical protein